MIEKIIEKLEALEEHCLSMHDWQGQTIAIEAKEIVQEVSKDGGWIPVEQKNPTLFESVYVTCISLVDERPPWVIEGIYGTEGWHGMSYMLRWGEAKVIAWMPKELPAPYQKGE